MGKRREEGEQFSLHSCGLPGFDIEALALCAHTTKLQGNCQIPEGSEKKVVSNLACSNATSTIIISSLRSETVILFIFSTAFSIVPG